MNTTAILLSVISIWGVAVMTPGPNFLVAVQTAVKASRLPGLFVVFGTCTGTIIWAIAGYFGIAYLFIAVPWIYSILKVLGGCYITYLGIRIIIGMRQSTTTLDIPQKSSHGLLFHWWKGLLTNLANPKTAMFITSLFASVLPKEPTLSVGLLIVGLMVIISLSWYSLVVLIFASKKFVNEYRKMRRWMEGFAAIIFIAFGAKLVFGNR